jgi:hypothetical protein
MKLPESFIDSINAYARPNAFALFVRDGPLNRNQRASSGKSSGAELLIILNVGRKLIAEKAPGSNHIVGVTQSLHNQIAQARPYGIADKQGAGQHRNRRGDAQHYGEVGAPVIAKTSF